MDIVHYVTAALLGVVEGLTEFIPVSSTGHLILLVDLLGFAGPRGHVFEIVIQLGAILAVCWLYREKLWRTALGIFSEKKSQHFIAMIVIGFLPAMVLGAVFHDSIKTVLFSPMVVSVMLIVGGVIIVWIEKKRPEAHIAQIDDIDSKLALKIGLCQAIALIPGVSRSGATIMGALMLGVERKAATEFSFFLAIPTMLAATIYDTYKNRASLNFDDATLIAIGFIAAFISAILVVKTVIGFVSRHGFIPFAYYRIALGTLMLALLLG